MSTDKQQLLAALAAEPPLGNLRWQVLVGLDQRVLNSVLEQHYIRELNSASRFPPVSGEVPQDSNAFFLHELTFATPMMRFTNADLRDSRVALEMEVLAGGTLWATRSERNRWAVRRVDQIDTLRGPRLQLELSLSKILGASGSVDALGRAVLDFSTAAEMHFSMQTTPELQTRIETWFRAWFAALPAEHKYLELFRILMPDSPLMQPANFELRTQSYPQVESNGVLTFINMKDEPPGDTPGDGSGFPALTLQEHPATVLIDTLRTMCNALLVIYQRRFGGEVSWGRSPTGEAMATLSGVYMDVPEMATRLGLKFDPNGSIFRFCSRIDIETEASAAKVSGFTFTLKADHIAIQFTAEVWVEGRAANIEEQQLAMLEQHLCYLVSGRASGVPSFPGRFMHWQEITVEVGYVPGNGLTCVRDRNRDKQSSTSRSIIPDGQVPRLPLSSLPESEAPERGPQASAAPCQDCGCGQPIIGSWENGMLDVTLACLMCPRFDQDELGHRYCHYDILRDALRQLLEKHDEVNSLSSMLSQYFTNELVLESESMLDYVNEVFDLNYGQLLTADEYHRPADIAVFAQVRPGPNTPAVSPVRVNLLCGQTQQFSAGPGGTGAVWTVEPIDGNAQNSGSINPTTGLYTAPATLSARSFRVRITATRGNQSSSALVGIVRHPINVYPQICQFTANPREEMPLSLEAGTLLTGTPEWRIKSGPGRLEWEGLDCTYFAPRAGGSDPLYQVVEIELEIDGHTCSSWVHLERAEVSLDVEGIRRGNGVDLLGRTFEDEDYGLWEWEIEGPGELTEAFGNYIRYEPPADADADADADYAVVKARWWGDLGYWDRWYIIALPLGAFPPSESAVQPTPPRLPSVEGIPHRTGVDLVGHSFENAEYGSWEWALEGPGELIEVDGHYARYEPPVQSDVDHAEVIVRWSCERRYRIELPLQDPPVKALSGRMVDAPAPDSVPALRWTPPGPPGVRRRPGAPAPARADADSRPPTAASAPDTGPEPH